MQRCMSRNILCNCVGISLTGLTSNDSPYSANEIAEIDVDARKPRFIYSTYRDSPGMVIADNGKGIV